MADSRVADRLPRVLMWLLFVVILSGIIGALHPALYAARDHGAGPHGNHLRRDPARAQQLREEADQLVASASRSEAEHEDKTRFREIYDASIRPYLENPPADMFSPLRRRVPAEFQTALADLENICEEQRQLKRQSRLYLWLHAWLLVHVPLSIVLLVSRRGARRHGVALLNYGRPNTHAEKSSRSAST